MLTDRCQNSTRHTDYMEVLHKDDWCLAIIFYVIFKALDISAGPAHFSDRRASSGQSILSFTGPYGPPRHISGHQISNSAGPNDDKSHYVLFAWAPATHLGSFRAVLLLQQDASVARVGGGHVNQTHWRQCLDHAARDTSMWTSGTHPGTFLREAHGMVPSKQFCVWVVI